MFDVDDDLRSNPFEERGDDTIQPSHDPLEVLVVPVMRFGAKKFKEALITQGLSTHERGDGLFQEDL